MLASQVTHVPPRDLVSKQIRNMLSYSREAFGSQCSRWGYDRFVVSDRMRNYFDPNKGCLFGAPKQPTYLKNRSGMGAKAT